MKNIKLLLATTAMLSIGAMAANADDEPSLNSNQATLDIAASFVRPITATAEQYLGFGIMVADEGGKTVIVKTDGTLDSASTAPILSKSSGTNYSAGGSLQHDNFNAGKIRFAGFDCFKGMHGTSSVASMVKLNIADQSVELVPVGSGYNNVTCGTVDTFTTSFAVEDGDVVANIGGTLHTVDLTEAGVSDHLRCKGSTTVTMVATDF